MTRRQWSTIREATIAAAGGMCANRCRSGCVILDVVPIGVTRGYVALCRSCRVRRDAPQTIKKALATRRARAAQGKLFSVKGRAA